MKFRALSDLCKKTSKCRLSDIKRKKALVPVEDEDQQLLILTVFAVRYTMLDYLSYPMDDKEKITINHILVDYLKNENQMKQLIFVNYNV